MDTVLTINNLKLAVASARHYSSDYRYFNKYNYPVYQKIVRAVTSINGNVVLLAFEYRNKNSYSKNNDFIHKALNALKTSKLTPGGKFFLFHNPVMALNNQNIFYVWALKLII